MEGIVLLKKRVTIQDIADALDISRNTVSKAINNSDGIADATREKILQKAIELGYKQFSYVNSITGLSSGSSGLLPEPNGFQGEIALLTTRYLNYSHFASLMLDKFHQDISQLGYTMNTHRVTPGDLANKSLPLTLNLEQVKGIICIEMFDWDYDEMLCELDVPVLFVDGPSKIDGRSLPADQLYMDNTTELRRFMHDMHKQGIARIGFIGDYGHCESFCERFMAVAMSQFLSGTPMDPRYIIRHNDFESLRDQLMRLDSLPELFVCANDFVAMDAIEAFAGMGIRVPQDVMLCGFDDSSESRHSNPPLTTIHIHTQVIAYAAVHLLLTRINEPSLDFRTVHTETNLIYRDSTDLSLFKGAK